MLLVGGASGSGVSWLRLLHCLRCWSLTCVRNALEKVLQDRGSKYHDIQANVILKEDQREKAMRNVMLAKCKCLNASIERDEQKTLYLLRDIKRRLSESEVVIMKRTRRD